MKITVSERIEQNGEAVERSLSVDLGEIGNPEFGGPSDVQIAHDASIELFRAMAQEMPRISKA